VVDKIAPLQRKRTGLAVYGGMSADTILPPTHHFL